MKQGQQKRIPATQPGSKQKTHLFGAYNWAQDTISWQAVERKNSTTFIEFLEYLLVKQYAMERVVLVMDNVSYHKSAAALAALSLFEHRVRVIWLPPYCSELNLIERFWRYLKDLACANKLEDDISGVLKSVEKIMTQQNQPTSHLRFCVSKNL
jgi:putative transposase